MTLTELVLRRDPIVEIGGAEANALYNDVRKLCGLEPRPLPDGMGLRRERRADNNGYDWFIVPLVK